MIFGVDLGTRRLAIACPSAGYVWVDSLERAATRRDFATEVQAGSELGKRARLALLRAELAYAETNLFIAERPLLHRHPPNVKTAVGMGLSAGAALADMPGRVVLLEHPSLWKKALCDNGNASKNDIRTWLETHHPACAALCGESEDAFDAVGIALGGSILASAGLL